MESFGTCFDYLSSREITPHTLITGVYYDILKMFLFQILWEGHMNVNIQTNFMTMQILYLKMSLICKYYRGLVHNKII